MFKESEVSELPALLDRNQGIGRFSFVVLFLLCRVVLWRERCSTRAR